MVSGDKVQLILPAGGITEADNVSATNPLPVTMAVIGAPELSPVRAEDSPGASGDAGMVMLARRTDTGPTATSNADGDYEFLQVQTGSLFVRMPLDVDSPCTHEDAASGTGDVGIVQLSVRKDAGGTSTTNDGDYEHVLSSRGALWTNAMGFMVTKSFTATRASAEHAAYAANQLWSDTAAGATGTLWTLTGAARASGGSGVITDMVITLDGDVATQLQGEVFLFNSAVTVTNLGDKDAFALSDTDILKCVGKVPFVLEDVGNNGFYHAQGLNIGFTCVGSADLRALIRVKNAYDPAAGSEVLTVMAKIVQVD